MRIAERALRGAGVLSSVTRIEPVEGGMISQAFQVETDGGVYFLKTDTRALPGFFTAEAEGLRLLRETGTVRVPTVLAEADATPGAPGFLLAEYIDHSFRGAADRKVAARLGERIAELHRTSAATPPPGYGLEKDNYLGFSPQLEGWDTDWVRFYRERRIRPQVEMAQGRGLLVPELHCGLERVMERMEELLEGVERQPALIHGDLWSGNVLCSRDGEPAIVDPAVYYADREAELAYTELFGGFAPEFYEVYESVYPTAPGREERRDLYNLYHLLNHLNTFGMKYARHVERVVRSLGC